MTVNNHSEGNADVPSTTRRNFLAGVGASATVALSGCNGLPVSFRGKAVCNDPEPNSPLVIDMHCHIMNLQDADKVAFVKNRFGDKLGPISNLLPNIDEAISQPAFVTTSRARAERERLKKQFMKLRTKTDDFTQTFCQVAVDNQKGYLFAGSNNQPSGFLSDRVRNAARLMELFPDVDLFTPSIVDFYEGEVSEYSSVIEQALLYSAITVASGGRHVPLASFHPGRCYVPGADPAAARNSFEFQLQFKMLEFAITNLGFIGVKVHPSAGFAPFDNAKNGCPEDAPPDRAPQYDQAMSALFALCRRLDVPVLTHNGTGIASYKSCMTMRNTNRPDQWGSAIEAANNLTHDFSDIPIPPENTLRVCLAHFADGFTRTNPPRPTEWLEIALNWIKRQDGIYLDISDQNEWYYGSHRSFNVPYRADIGIKQEYETAFREIVQKNAGLADRILYGSDWHMPDTALIGDRYFPGMSNMIHSALGKKTAQKIMGENAVDFYGLRKNAANRVRLDAFLTDHDIAADDHRVGWRQKVDTLRVT